MPQRSSRLHKDLRAIGAAFKTLAYHFERIAPLLGEQEDVKVTDRTSGTKVMPPTLTPARLRALRLHGKYIGTIRRLKPSQRAKVKKIRAAQGVQAAIAYASRMAPHATEVPGRAAINNDTRPRRKRRFSAQQRAAMKLQGKYMGALRGLKPRQRSKLKKIRAAKGINAAIRAAG